MKVAGATFELPARVARPQVRVKRMRIARESAGPVRVPVAIETDRAAGEAPAAPPLAAMEAPIDHALTAEDVLIGRPLVAVRIRRHARWRLQSPSRSQPRQNRRRHAGRP